MGKGWMRNIQGNARTELVGVVDIRKEAAIAAAKEYGLPEDRAFTSLKKAIKVCAPDFVADITIPEGHCPTTVTTLKHKLPVIGEKPLADSMAHATKMLKASKKARRLYMVSQSRRYDVNHISMARALKSNAIGQITTLNCDFYIGAHFGGFRDEMPSPLILDMAIHHFDMCRMFVDADPIAVYAHEFNPKGSWYKGDVAASCIFEMSDGIVFTYRGSWCAEGLSTSWNGNWRVIGNRGTMLLEQDRFPTAQRVKVDGKPGFMVELEDVEIAKATTNGDGIAGSLNEFLDALESGVKPQCEVQDNIKSLAMVFAAMKSARSGKRVKITW
jgi:predicted dehydrogenase